jgi:hypothetical protein
MAVVRALRREWDRINQGHFRRALRPPLILLSRGETRIPRRIAKLAMLRLKLDPRGRARAVEEAHRVRRQRRIRSKSVGLNKNDRWQDFHFLPP